MVNQHIRACLAGSVAVVAIASATPALAQTHDFNVAAQPAKTGVPKFARQAGIQVLANERDLRNKSSRAVKGRMSTEKGLRNLIAGTDLAFRMTGSGTYMLFAREDTSATPASSVQQPSAEAGRQSAPPQEIVVTAQKREQTVIDVPASITAIQGEEVAKKNLASFTEVASLVPNFNVSYQRGTNATPTLTIRGISNEGSVARVNESSVALYMDEVYLGDESMLNGLIFDIERVEVLRGPQGTLFGRNTTGGLGHFISAKPTSELSGHASALYGSDNWVSLEGAVSGPLSDRVRFRAAGKYDRHDGHYENFLDQDPATSGRQRPPGVESNVGDREVWGVRGILDVDLTDDVLLRLTALHSENNSETPGGRAPGVLDPADPTGGTLCSLDRILAGVCISRVQINFGQPANGLRKAGQASTNLTSEQRAVRQRTNMFTASITADFDWATLTSISNYSNSDYAEGRDGDTGPDDIGIAFDARGDTLNEEWQASQELRLSGSASSFDWVVGGYYYTDSKESTYIANTVAPSRPRAISQSRVDTESIAAFAQVDYAIAPKLTLTVGGRYTDEVRELKLATATIEGVGMEDVLSQVTAPRSHTTDLTGKVGLSWEPSDDTTVYLNYSRGAKSPAFNTVFSGSPAEFGGGNARVVGPVAQEKLDAYEFGVKQRFLDRKLSINASAFYYDFKGKQLILRRFENGVAVSEFLNAGKARIYGAELETYYAPNRYFDLSFSGGLLETEITDSNVIVADPFSQPVPLQGLPLPNTPKWNFNAVAAFHVPDDRLGEITLQAELNGTGSVNYSLTNYALAADKSHIITNIRAIWESPSGRFNAQVFVTNLFNENYYLNLADSVIGSLGFIASTDTEGRLWGVKVGAKF